MSPFLENTFITDLGFGGGFALWGFRAMAGGCGGCRTMRYGFNRAFSKNKNSLKWGQGDFIALSAMKALASFCRTLGENGKRKILLSESGTLRLTADEVSLVATLAAAQSNQIPLCRAHLLWLQGNDRTAAACQAAQQYGLICSEADIYIEEPRVEISQISRNSPNAPDFGTLSAIHSDRLH